MDRFLHSLLNIDRRWIYLVLAIVLIWALIIGKAVNPIVLPPTQQLYDAVEAAPAGPGQAHLILLGMTFSAGTMGENANQARAIIRHLMLRHKKFAIISIAEPQGAEYSRRMVTDIAKQYNYEYGKDWISFGYKINSLAFYKAFTKDIYSIVPTDGVEAKPLRSFPIMQGINSANDIALEIEITASASVYNWIQLVQPATKPRMKIGYACTGIMATEAYPFLDSGQMVGLLPGLKGAADYEKLVDDLETREYRAGRITHLFNPDAPASLKLPPPARRLMFTQGAAHLVIILFIILGNVGLLITKRRARLAEKEAHNG